MDSRFRPVRIVSDTSALTVRSHTGPRPAHGALILQLNGSFVYAPNSGFAGTDSFTYLANAGNGDSNIATVSLTITNLPPVAQNDVYAVAPGGTLQIDAPGVLVNDFNVA